MPTKHSHNCLTVFSVFFLSASAFHPACTSKELRPIERYQETAMSTSTAAVNINTASEGELQKIPGIGPGLAKKIIEHRTLHGPFRRAEHILIVEGISEKRFHEFRMFILIE
jgi:competence ComEA-like helix-hairpin-helix protein